MNQQQYQQGRDVLIESLNWTSESILQFATEVFKSEFKSEFKSDIRNELVSLVEGLKEDFISETNKMINRITNFGGSDD